MPTSTTVSGTISRTNGKGFMLQEYAGRWFNVSKYATPPPIIPLAGTEVTLTLDGSSFVRAIEQSTGSQFLPGFAPDRAGRAERSDGATGPLSTRLACLSAAATFLAPRSEFKSADVVNIAAVFERWVQGEQS